MQQPAVMKLLEKILPWVGSGGCWPRPRGLWVSCTRAVASCPPCRCPVLRFPSPVGSDSRVWGNHRGPCAAGRGDRFVSRETGAVLSQKKKTKTTSSGLFWGSREARNVCSSRWLLLDFKPLGAARQQLPQARALPFYGRGSLRREGRGCSWARGSWQQPQDPTTPDVALQAPS